MQENFSRINNPLGQRVQILSDKINNMKFGNDTTSQKKLQALQSNLDQLQEHFQRGKSCFQKQSFELKHIFSKIHKQMTYDYQGTDRLIKQEIRRCEQRYCQLTQLHQDQRRINDARIIKFIDEKCVALRQMIDLQAKQRQKRSQDIQNSLNGDLNEIKEKIEQQKRINSETLQEIQQNFAQELGKLRQEFNDQCEKEAESQADFYKMLRDLLKKVKNEISQDRNKRQNMQESILALIQKMCDKAIQSSS